MIVLFLHQTPLRALRLCEIIFVFFSRKGAKTAKNFNLSFVVTTNTFAYFAPWRELFFVSRKGAEAAEYFDVCFVLTPNTFACFAPWREMSFFLSPRHQDCRERSIYDTEVKKHICLNSEHVGRNSDDQYPVLLITITIKGSGRSASSIGP